MLIAVTPPGSDARYAGDDLTPEGSQRLEMKRPHAVTTLKGSQPLFSVSDRSGTPQRGTSEEYSGERDGALPSNSEGVDRRARSDRELCGAKGWHRHAQTTTATNTFNLRKSRDQLIV